MPKEYNAYAQSAAKSALQPIRFEPAELTRHQVEVKVDYCGICHSDLSMADNEWGMTQYPIVPGHEIVGTVSAVGADVTHLKPGQRVGVGWFAGSCERCLQCISGHQNLCANAEQTIVGRPGGFADYVRADGLWTIPLPDSMDGASAGPLFCGGITVFGPIVEFGIKPTDKVGVVGIGGLGHMALQFLSKWGCEVFAFTSNPQKSEGAKKFGAHHIIDSTESGALKKLAGQLDFILVTANVKLDWDSYINMLSPKGRLHFVGAVLEPIPVAAFSLIGAQRSISGSPLGTPATVHKMLDFATRHRIAPQIETFAMSDVNKAFDHLKAGKARYRIVLKADF